MLKSKLLELFSSLSKSELKEFGKYLEGTSYRKSGKVFNMYNYLAKQYPDFPEKKMDKAVVAKKILTDQKNAAKQMLDTMTRLTGVLEDFLIKKELEENKTKRDFVLLDALKKRKLDRQFFQKISNVEKAWKKKRPVGVESLHAHYHLAQSAFFHPNSDLFLDQTVSAGELLRRFDQYYFGKKLLLAMMMKQINVEYNDSNDTILLLDEILSLANSGVYDSDPHIYLFSKILKAQEESEVKNFAHLQEEFEKAMAFMNSDERLDVMRILVSFCLVNNARGDKNALQELFDLYAFSARERIIIEDGYVEGNQFNHIVAVACIAGELEWAHQFIEDYSPYLFEEQKEDLLAVCKARILFNQSEYGMALQVLAQVKFHDISYGLNGRGLQLHCYYELGDEYDDLFFNLVKSFSTFLRRNNELNKTYTNSLLSFIRFTKKLHLARSDRNNDPNKLLQEIKDAEFVSYRTWLVEKAEGLCAFRK